MTDFPQPFVFSDCAPKAEENDTTGLSTEAYQVDVLRPDIAYGAGNRRRRHQFPPVGLKRGGYVGGFRDNSPLPSHISVWSWSALFREE